MTIPESKLDEWQQITEMATEGPWIWGQGDYWEPVTAEEHLNGVEGDLVLLTEWGDPLEEEWMGQSIFPRMIIRSDDILDNADDARFIAEARSMVPQLLDEVQRLRKLVNVMGDGLDVVSVCEFCGGES